MQVECPYCEAPLDVDSKVERLRCGECLREFRVHRAQEIVCPRCASVLEAPAGVRVLLCGQCRERIELAPPPAEARERFSAGESLLPAEPADEATAHEETSVIVSADTPEQERLEVAREQFAENYEILESLGHGGMGAIYKARQKQPPRVVVLKVMLSGRFASPRYRLRFEREAQAVARLKHPGIVGVYEYGEVNGQPYFTMEYVEGCSIKEYVVRHNLDKRKTCQLIMKVCKAVAYAHQRGVIHRDIKPNNILVDGEGNPRLLDFGLARQAGNLGDEEPQMTEAGEVMGTPSYMSPEQTLGRPEEIDIRTDVYSIGVLLYELLTDTLPYRIDRTRPLESLRVIREFMPKRPSVVNPRIDGDLDSVVMKCLEKERDLRYQSAIELAEDVARYLRGKPVEARPSTAFYQFRKLLWRHRSVVLPILVGLLALAGVTGFFVWRLARAKEQASLRASSQRAVGQEAVAQREELLGFIMELRSVRRTVEGLLAEERWEDAHRIASFAEANLPAEAGLAGLTAEVKRAIVSGATRERAEVDELIEEMRFREARERIERLRNMAHRLNLPDLAEQTGEAAASFEEDCWQSLFSYIQQNKRSARALERFLAECPSSSHAPEAQDLLDRLLASIRFRKWPFSAEGARNHQKATAEVLELPIEYEIVLPGDARMHLSLVPAGQFDMGSYGEGEGFNADQEPEHVVRISNPFYISVTEVTQEQFEAVMGRTSGGASVAAGQGAAANMPAPVSWDDAQLFCQKLSRRNRDGVTIRLPTEAQWEFACRAGSRGLYTYGDDLTAQQLGGWAWYRENSGGQPHAVALKRPNAWGLHDVHGNMLEWCRDWYEARYYLSSSMQDPHGPETGTYKVLRGGSWADGPEECRSAYRKAARPDSLRPTYGMRVCFEVVAEGAEQTFGGLLLAAPER
jgi:formylglycine-generating enzyme required for sulfatase activity/tRNA A-37 threonylcarbamoyl transferase component Bud32